MNHLKKVLIKKTVTILREKVVYPRRKRTSKAAKETFPFIYKKSKLVQGSNFRIFRTKNRNKTSTSKLAGTR